MLTDIVGTTVVSAIILLIYGAYLSTQGLSPAQIAVISRNLGGSWVFYVTGAIGMGFSVLGGYVCARVSRQREYRLAAIVAALSAFFGLALSYDQYSVVVNAAFFIGGIAGVMAGGHWGYRRNRHAAT